jgi:hypothetical protein
VVPRKVVIGLVVVVGALVVLGPTGLLRQAVTAGVWHTVFHGLNALGHHASHKVLR